MPQVVYRCFSFHHLVFEPRFFDFSIEGDFECHNEYHGQKNFC